MSIYPNKTRYTVARRRLVTLYETVDIELPSGLDQEAIYEQLRTACELSDSDPTQTPYTGSYLHWNGWLEPANSDHPSYDNTRLMHDEPGATPIPAHQFDAQYSYTGGRSNLLDESLLERWRGASVYVDTHRRHTEESLYEFFDVKNCRAHTVIDAFNRLKITEAQTFEEADIVITRNTPASIHCGQRALAHGKLVITRDAITSVTYDLLELLDMKERDERHYNPLTYQRYLLDLTRRQEAPLSAPTRLPNFLNRSDHRPWIHQYHVTRVSLHGDALKTRAHVRSIATFLSQQESSGGFPKRPKSLEAYAPHAFVGFARDERGAPSGENLTCVYNQQLISVEPHLASLTREGVLMICLSAHRVVDLVDELERYLDEVRVLVAENCVSTLIVIDDPQVNHNEAQKSASQSANLRALGDAPDDALDPGPDLIKREVIRRIPSESIYQALSQSSLNAGLKLIGVQRVDMSSPHLGRTLWWMTLYLRELSVTYQHHAEKRFDVTPHKSELSLSSGVLSYTEARHQNIQAPLTMRCIPSSPVKVSKQLWVGETRTLIASAPLTRGFVFELLRNLPERITQSFDAPWMHHGALEGWSPRGAEADMPEGRFNFIDALRLVDVINTLCGCQPAYVIKRVGDTAGDSQIHYPDNVMRRYSDRLTDHSDLTFKNIGGGYAYACYDEATPWARTKGYRLPTRAEWLSVAYLGAPQGELNLEAIRATSHELSFNGPITSTRRKTKGSEESAAPSRPAPIASGAPNLLGVYDLFGGVREWVNDATSNKAVAMGGSFLTTPREALKIRPLTPQIDLEYGERDLGVRLVFQGR